MRIMNIFAEKAGDNYNKKSPTIAFLGDSVTQGCFEVYKKDESVIETVFDQNFAYHSYVAKILSVLYPSVPVNIINAGISGDNAVHGLSRLQRDVLCHNPDLVVVCFGLNDVCNGLDKIDNYTTALDGIFKALHERDIEVIFMTHNMMNTYTSHSITDADIKNIADAAAKRQTNGEVDKYIEAALKVCRDNCVTVCDCYKKWKKMYKCGVDTTALLANGINHPSRDLNKLFAISLVETMFN
ncbi:MAG: GDSL family lipase [Clostridia bacterium]|nr:GDSL family lipase [Clostridia bacterium]